ncbi:MAG: acyl-CoA dehydrogenase family protein [Myxococcales bacterium]|nr:acyl-CoA dehydrogenase family protein [Myxococcales bacterium]
MADMTYAKGASFLLEEVGKQDIFVPEAFDAEHRAFAKTTLDFVRNEVLPNRERLEKKDYDLSAALLRKAGELGLTMIDVPEKYEGLGADKLTSMITSDVMGLTGSFCTTYMAHVGIGSLPIVFFGTDAQKRKYLPKLASAEWIGAYCLTEPTSGSDALGARCKAVLSEDGTHYVLNGTKQFITNAGFADVFTVFAKIDGEKFTAFIIEKSNPGLKLGAEEQKMGIHGSSTRQVILEDCRVPVENVLGEIGKGHHIAFGILNLGRLKLGIGCAGSARDLIKMTVEYTTQRTQFGTPLAEFGLIQKKIAEQTIRLYATESIVYRVSGDVDRCERALHAAHPDDDQAMLQALAEYSVECAMTKVYGSETLDFVVDEAVQSHGGYGYIAEYPVEEAYRDARIARLYEGTSEINRLLIPAQLLKKAMKGEIPLLERAAEIAQEIAHPEKIPAAIPAGPLGREVRDTELAKRAALYLLNEAVSTYAMGIDKQQEVLALLADVLTEAYVLDSTVGRTLARIESDGPVKSEVPIKITQAYTAEAVRRIQGWGEELLSGMHDGDELEAKMSELALFVRPSRVNVIALKRDVARDVIDAGGYRYFIL